MPAELRTEPETDAGAAAHTEDAHKPISAKNNAEWNLRNITNSM
jgi:hypothetical protein